MPLNGLIIAVTLDNNETKCKTPQILRGTSKLKHSMVNPYYLSLTQSSTRDFTTLLLSVYDNHIFSLLDVIYTKRIVNTHSIYILMTKVAKFYTSFLICDN